jgi:adenosylcobyric acid synthase
MRYVGLLPFVSHGLPDEDGAAMPTPRGGAPRVCVVRYPTASNLDEFKPLEQVADVHWVTTPAGLAGCSMVVLPGSKHVAGDLDWLRAGGLADRVVELAQAGTPLVGVCGGLQMLGARTRDPAGVDGSRPGLGLLPIETYYRDEKHTERVEVTFGALDPPFEGLRGLVVPGYEIRHGETSVLGGKGNAARVFQSGSVLGLTSHGVLGNPAVLDVLFGARPHRGLDSVFDELADLVEERFDVPALLRVAGVET